MNRKKISLSVCLISTLFLFGCTEFGLSSNAKFSALNSTKILAGENFDGGSDDGFSDGFDDNGFNPETDKWAFEDQSDNGFNGNETSDGGNGGSNTSDGGNGNRDTNDGGRGSADTKDGGESELTSIPLIRLCSDKRLTQDEDDLTTPDDEDPTKIKPVITAKTLRFIVTDLNDKILCASNDTAKIRSQILNNGSLTLDSSICNKPVTISSKIYLITDEDKNLFDTEKKGDHPTLLKRVLKRRGVKVLIADNPKSKRLDMSDEISEDLYEKCDKMASPLFIDMRNVSHREKGFELSAPWNGVLFDILGENATPAPHTKSQISWFDNAKMAFVVLPDGNGQVKGVDQLFGDNTKGPDGQFSDNGFHALAKFDGLSISGPRGHRDGVINSDDEIYKHLRLWSDKNHDATSDAGELISLSDAGVISIDLIYDANFVETDRYGNSVKFKSVVEMSDGQLNLIFDVWFRIYK